MASSRSTITSRWDSPASPSPEHADVKESLLTPPRESRSASPDSSCAICLNKLENRCFTDSCLHTFCFACLLEWSKVKPECPLCKQSFKSIIHNIRAVDDYDQHYLHQTPRYHETPDFERNLFPATPDGRRFRYRTTMADGYYPSTPDFLRDYQADWFVPTLSRRERQERALRRRLDMFDVQNLWRRRNAATTETRRRVYRYRLRLRQMQNAQQGYRDTSPEFFRANPACTHRLVPWLNRELAVLLYNAETQIAFVLELIMSLIVRYEILSEDMYQHLEPYLQHDTRQFLYEFYHFARSPLDMIGYDRIVDYEFAGQQHETPDEPLSSAATESSHPNEDPGIDINDEDIVLLPRDPRISMPSSTALRDRSAFTSPVTTRSSRYSHSGNTPELPPSPFPDSPLSPFLYLNSPVHYSARRSHSRPRWQNSIAAANQAQMENDTGQMLINRVKNFLSDSSSDPAARPLPQIISLSSASSDASDIEFVEEVKPKHKRTPEIVHISDSEEEINTDQPGPSWRNETGTLIAASSSSLSSDTSSCGSPTRKKSPPLSPYWNRKLRKRIWSPASSDYSRNVSPSNEELLLRDATALQHEDKHSKSSSSGAGSPNSAMGKKQRKKSGMARSWPYWKNGAHKKSLSPVSPTFNHNLLTGASRGASGSPEGPFHNKSPVFWKRNSRSFGKRILSPIFDSDSNHSAKLPENHCFSGTKMAVANDLTSAEIDFRLPSPPGLASSSVHLQENHPMSDRSQVSFPINLDFIGAVEPDSTKSSDSDSTIIMSKTKSSNSASADESPRRTKRTSKDLDGYKKCSKRAHMHESSLPLKKRHKHRSFRSRSSHSSSSPERSHSKSRLSSVIVRKTSRHVDELNERSSHHRRHKKKKRSKHKKSKHRDMTQS